MTFNRDLNTLRRVLARIVTDKNRQDWYDALGTPLMSAAVEWLDEQDGWHQDRRDAVHKDCITVTLPAAVADAAWDTPEYKAWLAAAQGDAQHP
jgi:hypothetical protein